MQTEHHVLISTCMSSSSLTASLLKPAAPLHSRQYMSFLLGPGSVLLPRIVFFLVYQKHTGHSIHIFFFSLLLKVNWKDSDPTHQKSLPLVCLSIIGTCHAFWTHHGHNFACSTTGNTWYGCCTVKVPINSYLWLSSNLEQLTYQASVAPEGKRMCAFPRHSDCFLQPMLCPHIPPDYTLHREERKWKKKMNMKSWHSLGFWIPFFTKPF